VGGKAVVKPARVRTNDLSHGCGESNYIVADFGFDLVDTFDAEIGALADGTGRLFRHHAGLGQSFAGRDFYGEPGSKAVFVAPDAAHLWAGIAQNQSGFAPVWNEPGQRILTGLPRRGQRSRPCDGRSISSYDILLGGSTQYLVPGCDRCVAHAMPQNRTALLRGTQQTDRSTIQSAE